MAREAANNTAAAHPDDTATLATASSIDSCDFIGSGNTHETNGSTKNTTVNTRNEDVDVGGEGVDDTTNEPGYGRVFEMAWNWYHGEDGEEEEEEEDKEDEDPVKRSKWKSTSTIREETVFFMDDTNGSKASNSKGRTTDSPNENKNKSYPLPKIMDHLEPSQDPNNNTNDGGLVTNNDDDNEESEILFFHPTDLLSASPARRPSREEEPNFQGPPSDVLSSPSMSSSEGNSLLVQQQQQQQQHHLPYSHFCMVKNNSVASSLSDQFSSQASSQESTRKENKTRMKLHRQLMHPYSEEDEEEESFSISMPEEEEDDDDDDYDVESLSEQSTDVQHRVQDPTKYSRRFGRGREPTKYSKRPDHGHGDDSAYNKENQSNRRRSNESMQNHYQQQQPQPPPEQEQQQQEEEQQQQQSQRQEHHQQQQSLQKQGRHHHQQQQSLQKQGRHHSAPRGPNTSYRTRRGISKTRPSSAPATNRATSLYFHGMERSSSFSSDDGHKFSHLYSRDELIEDKFLKMKKNNKKKKKNSRGSQNRPITKRKSKPKRSKTPTSTKSRANTAISDSWSRPSSTIQSPMAAAAVNSGGAFVGSFLNTMISAAESLQQLLVPESQQIHDNISSTVRNLSSQSTYSSSSEEIIVRRNDLQPSLGSSSGGGGGSGGGGESSKKTLQQEHQCQSPTAESRPSLLSSHQDESAGSSGRAGLRDIAAKAFSCSAIHSVNIEEEWANLRTSTTTTWKGIIHTDSVLHRTDIMTAAINSALAGSWPQPPKDDLHEQAGLTTASHLEEDEEAVGFEMPLQRYEEVEGITDESKLITCPSPPEQELHLASLEDAEPSITKTDSSYPSGSYHHLNDEEVEVDIDTKASGEFPRAAGFTIKSERAGHFDENQVALEKEQSLLSVEKKELDDFIMGRRQSAEPSACLTEFDEAIAQVLRASSVERGAIDEEVQLDELTREFNLFPVEPGDNDGDNDDDNVDVDDDMRGLRTLCLENRRPRSLSPRHVGARWIARIWQQSPDQQPQQQQLRRSPSPKRSRGRNYGERFAKLRQVNLRRQSLKS
ncbi:hypothetical protein ACA910_004434 [Epithemia clementina (nom. ined.)]